MNVYIISVAIRAQSEEEAGKKLAKALLYGDSDSTLYVHKVDENNG